MVALPWVPDIPAATKVVEQLALSILFENPQLRQSGEEDESALPLGYFSICHAPTTTEPTNQRTVWASALRITAAFFASDSSQVGAQAGSARPADTD